MGYDSTFPRRYYTHPAEFKDTAFFNPPYIFPDEALGNLKSEKISTLRLTNDVARPPFDFDRQQIERLHEKKKKPL